MEVRVTVVMIPVQTEVNNFLYSKSLKEYKGRRRGRY